MLFKYMSIEVDAAITLYPNSLNLKIVNTFVQNSLLNNQFKAILELFKC